MQTQDTLSREKIEVIAEGLFSAKDWVSFYGIPMYHLRDNNVVRLSYDKRRLPEEWEVVLFGNRYYVFLSKEKMIDDSEVISRIKLTPSQIKIILETDFSKKGVQSNLARLLDCSESHLSRIRRGMRRTNFTLARQLSEEERKYLFLSRKEVHTFFGMMLTVKAFFEKYNHKYKIKNLQDIYSMSANRKYFSLPVDWHSIRVGNTWLVYYQKSFHSST